MKKILVVCCMAMMAVSCFKDGPTNSYQYNLLASFEYVSDYDIKNQFGDDSLYFDTASGLGMGWNDVAFMHKLSADKKTHEGGFILSCLKGKLYADGYEADASGKYGCPTTSYEPEASGSHLPPRVSVLQRGWS